MNKNTSRFLIAGLLIAWAVDFFFFNKPFGIAFTLWIIIAIAGLFILSYLEKKKPHPLSILLAGLALVLSSASFLRQEPFTQVVSTLASLGLLMLLAMTFSNGHWLYFRLLDYIIRGIKWIISILASSWQIIFQKSKENDTDGKDDPANFQARKSNKIWPIVRGILLALPFLLILSALLAAADPIFEQKLSDLLAIFNIENLPEYFFRTINILMMAYLFIGVLVQAIYPKTAEERPQPNQPSIKKFLGSLETSIVLGSIIILFASFLIIQFRYFFGGVANINETAFTYSEYARRGFGELITVAVLSLGIYYLFHSITKLETKSLRRRFSIFSIFIFLQVLVMLVSSYQRLVLYEQAYGFSRLRTYSHLFLPWIAVLIITVIVLEILQRQGHLAFSLLIFATGFVATCIIFNIDGFIAKQNIERAKISSKEGYALDFYYLSELSSDAVPIMMNEFLSADPSYKDLLGANLACRWNAIQNSKHRPWQAYNLSYQQATNLLSENQEYWKPYQVKKSENDFQYTVEVNGEKFFCSYEWLFRD
ncbi:MAG TPA: DUF4173 domain-containing protein [Anaerolineaceae bacterium]|nr:DUF4173 domain-containing protein [Anaerolineaceae bacterium]